MSHYEIATPGPGALIESLRSIGYDLPTAVADLIDNSVTAGARNVELTFHWAGSHSWICILDDGRGMSESDLFKAMRPGSQNPLLARSATDLGRFGLGLKTASFSQARRLTVISKKENEAVAIREWDLDYVEREDEWRLLTTATPDVELWLAQLTERKSGTAVLWTNLDRLTGGEGVNDPAAHRRFNDAIDHVRDYLALIFHRFLEQKELKISINGNHIDPWDPFCEQHPATYKTPLEPIPFGDSVVEFRGFILPHKDKLNADEFKRLGGLNGWNAQQGFYVYRNRRLLVFGDWLRLGSPNPWTRDEQYKLARIRLDITNDSDGDWQLDVKKSRARPPSLIRARLTVLAAKIRTEARSVFAHRGEYGPRAPVPQDLQRPWKSTVRDGKRSYCIDRTHPAVAVILGKLKENRADIETLLRILEESVPVEQIWLDTAEQVNDRAVPYENIDITVLRSDLRRIFDGLKRSGLSSDSAREQLCHIEPFNRYPDLIANL